MSLEVDKNPMSPRDPKDAQKINYFTEQKKTTTKSQISRFFFFIWKKKIKATNPICSVMHKGSSMVDGYSSEEA